MKSLKIIILFKKVKGQGQNEELSQTGGDKKVTQLNAKWDFGLDPGTEKKTIRNSKI